MASQETKQLDEINASRRAIILGGGAAALAAAFLPATAKAATTVSTFTDADILNFALNLEYLEANFYYLAAFGTTINTPNAAVTAAGGAQIPIAGVGTQGTVVIPSLTRCRSQSPMLQATPSRLQSRRASACSFCRRRSVLQQSHNHRSTSIPHSTHWRWRRASAPPSTAT